METSWAACCIGRALGGYEEETVGEFCAASRSARVVIDVGACTGFYTLLALGSSPGCRVIAFEPLPANQERVPANLRANKWEHRCRLRPECVSDTRGPGKLHVPHTRYGVISSSSLNPNGFRGMPGELVETVCTTLDSAVPEDTPVDLVKIDVEGFEGAVLRGMERVMSERRPTIILEYSEETTPEVRLILDLFGYDVYHIRASGLVRVSELLPDNAFRNYLAKPRRS